MNQDSHNLLYKHIQNLYAKANCEINILNDDLLINELINKKLSIDQLNSICTIRYWYWVHVLGKMRYIKKTHDATTETTIETNLSFISTVGSDYAKSRGAHQDEFGINTYYINQTKANCFGKLLLQSNSVKRNPGNARILYIGARTEAEILYMSNFGINPHNITAIDLHSYSPLIQLGDMHELSFPEEKFDACILTHCIAYSEAPEIAFKEAIRVLKNDGSLIFTVSTTHESKGYKQKTDRSSRPRTGAKKVLAFEEYYKLAQNLVDKENETKDIYIEIKNQPFMKAGIITK